MLNVKRIDIATDYSRWPSGRYEREGRFSGERFRDEILLPALKEYDQVIVNLDTVAGFSYSFLDEAFAGAVRALGSVVFDRLRFEAVERSYLIATIETYMNDAAEEAQGGGRGE